MAQNFDIVIIGGGILGTSLSFFLSCLNTSKRIVVVEQSRNVALHTSGRNTGKVHAPYLYNPQKKKISAKTALHGFSMWEEFAKMNNIPFNKDGVIEVALEKNETRTLEKYLKWGKQNGLKEEDLEIQDKNEIKKIEPEINCEAALIVHRDGSTDYAKLTKKLMEYSKNEGTKLLLNKKVTNIKKEKDVWKITLNNNEEIVGKFIINAAGGNAVDIAHMTETSEKLTDIHFRGEYWIAPKEYNQLTKKSVYSVPNFPEYPFLDPHWIIRVGGNCEIGPNAVPVFSPYGYSNTENIKEFIPKMLEMLGTGARKIIFNKQFQELAMNEFHSSISKTAMIDRVKRFLPKIDPTKITKKGTAGIRSSVINEKGEFVSDMVLVNNDMSFHILNYNSPGATGALPFATYIVNKLNNEGFIKNDKEDAFCGSWRFIDIIEKLE